MNDANIATGVLGLVIALLAAAIGYTIRTLIHHHRMRRSSERLNRPEL